MNQDDDAVTVRLSGPQVRCQHCGWSHEAADETELFAAFAAHRCPVESEPPTGQ